MAQKKKHTYTAATTGESTSAAPRREAKPVGNATGLRVGAFILWILGLVCEVLAYMVLIGKINLKFMPTMYQLIAFIVLDMIFVLIGSQLWKKANRIKPASKSNAFLFWLWNNMGVIAAVICFVPLIVLLLTNKDLDKRTKTIATVVAIIALLIGGVGSYDFDPISSEEQQSAINAITAEVYWTQFGKVYHTHDDCQALNRTDNLYYGSVEQAIAANRTRLCSFCANRDDITGVKTDDIDVTEVLEALDNAA